MLNSELTSVLLQGFHATWKTLKTWDFVIYFFRPGKCLEFAQKLWKTWNFNSNMEKLVLCKFCFQDVIFKKILIYVWHICIINTNIASKPNWPGISLHLPGNNLESTWNFVSPEKWEPCLIWKINEHLF